MDLCPRYRWRLVLPALVLFAGQAAAQDIQANDGDAAPASAQTATGAAAQLSQPELEQMLAPVALYPDALLAQILMAATYPLEVVEAARWSDANPDLSGDAAIQAVASQGWDASVKSLVAFPEVLATMSDRIEWTERLGDAFLDQRAQVMDAVQDLRRRAQVAGTLGDDADKLDVEQDNGDIEIGNDDAGELYVPYCDPFAAYGAWPWAQYPPVLWAPWPDYYGSGPCSWAAGIFVQPVFLFGSFAWHRHRLHDRRFPHPQGGAFAWRHDPIHRHGVAYRNPAMNSRPRAEPAPAAPALDAGVPLPGAISGYAYGPGMARVAPQRYGNAAAAARVTSRPGLRSFRGPAIGSRAGAPMPAVGGGARAARSGSGRSH